MPTMGSARGSSSSGWATAVAMRAAAAGSRNYQGCVSDAMGVLVAKGEG